MGGRQELKEKDLKEGKFLDVGGDRGKGFQLFYKQTGQGPEKVLLIMGFVCTHHLWKYQVEYFGQHPEKYTVVAFDNRGTGYSRYNKLDVSTREYAQDTRELVRHLGWDRFHLVGLSMGGMISLEFASAYPELLASLTLCVTHAGGRYAMGVPAAGLQTIAWMELARSRRQRVQHLMNLLYSQEMPAERYAEVFAWHMATFKFHPIWPTLAQQRAIATHYVSTDRLKKIAACGFPILVMTGTADALVNPYNSHILADILGAKLVLFEGSGHMIHTEDHEEFNHQLQLHFEK